MKQALKGSFSRAGGHAARPDVASFVLFRWVLRLCLVPLLLVIAVLVPSTAQASTSCGTANGHTLCVTVPDTPLSGDATVTITNDPNSGDVFATWIPSGKSAITLIRSFAPSPSTNDYSFVWPTRKYLDTSGTLRVQYKSTSSTPVDVAVTLANGNATDFQHSPNDWASFLPGPWTGAADPVVMAVGDGASNEVTSNAVANQVATANPSLFFYLGDIYETGTFTEMRNHYGVSEMDVPGGGTLWGATANVSQPTMGNHEWTERTAWVDYWHGRPLYTSFIFGGVLFLDLNSNVSMAAGSAQYQFVQSAITAPGAPACIVTYWHIPAIKGSTIKDSQRAMWALLSNNGGDLLLVASAHSMDEYVPLDANFNAGTPGAHLVELIAGSGGHSLSGNLSDSRIAWSKSKTAGVLALTLNGAHSEGTATTLGWAFKDLSGSTLRSNSVACSVGANQAPVVNAGPDQQITLPNSAALSGTATDDGLPNPPGALTTTWSTVSGPGTVTFGDASSLSTTASFSDPGTYVLHLTADDSALQSTDDLTVTVNPAGANQAPVVNAGPDQQITLPNSAALSGTATDDGLPNPPGALTTTWSTVSGPGTVTFGDASSLSTTASFSDPGTYVLHLTADDSALQSTDDLTVTVNPAGVGISFSNLGSSGVPDIKNNSDASAYATALWTPPSSGLIMLFVYHGISSGVVNPPTVSGNSVTWTQIATVTNSAGTIRFTLFGANASGSTTGATTIDFGGQTQVNCFASFFKADGVDLSGGVAAAFVQAVAKPNANTTGFSITLGAAANVNDRAISGWGHTAVEDTLPRASWTEADDLQNSSPNRSVETQYRSDAFETTASASWASLQNALGIVAELKAA